MLGVETKTSTRRPIRVIGITSMQGRPWMLTSPSPIFVGIEWNPVREFRVVTKVMGKSDIAIIQEPWVYREKNFGFGRDP